MSVGQVIENIYRWDGKQVVVDGWLGKCAGYDCAIFPDSSLARSSSLEAWGKGLSIGYVPVFDEAAASLQFSRVLLTAKINDDCYPHNCLDRADILQPISIRPFATDSQEKVR